MATAMALRKDLVFLIMQYCEEENLTMTAHMLEQETGYFFDIDYFEELMLQGKWDDVEGYISGFTLVDDNDYSRKIYFEIRKHKYIEALDRGEYDVALGILRNDLKVFAAANKELHKEMAQLLALDDFREHESLASFGDAESARKIMAKELRRIAKANPLLQGTTTFPKFDKSRLKRLINQSLNWQHMSCANPHPEPHVDTLFTDHVCPGSDGASKPEKSTSSSSVVTESEVTAKQTSSDDINDRPNSPNLKTSKPVNEMASPSAEASSCCQHSLSALPNEFPQTLERVLDMGSSALITMDFHPVYEPLLLVGKSGGEVEIWDVYSSEKLFGTAFELRERPLATSVNCVCWSPNGNFFGAATSNGVIRTYFLPAKNNDCEKRLEIVAHIGNVNDLEFSNPDGNLVVISCGDDKLIKVWDATTGEKLYIFEGHEAPVYSVCSHMRENVDFLFSTSTSGEIKAWLFDNMGARVTFNSPGLCCMKMAYSNDRERLFSCGTNKNGESIMVEWNEMEGVVVRKYKGLSKYSSSAVRFATIHNRFLAAGDDHSIKVWDMDNAEVLAVLDAGGGLQASSNVCFSTAGNLLAVTADGNRIKVLANDLGHELMSTPEEFFRKCFENPERVVQEGVAAGDSVATAAAEDVSEGGIPKEEAETVEAKMPSLSKIVQVSNCQYLLLTSPVKNNPIRRLVYTHSGNGILALDEDGTHLLWRWAKTDANLHGLANAKFPAQLLQPKSGLQMRNDLPSNVVVRPCFALSKNDSYIISSSGGSISLYNMQLFKKIKTVMASPPAAATCIVFYPPDNNIVAIGMDNSRIVIYNVRIDEVIRELEVHSSAISGLAFAPTLGKLVSCGTDAEIVLWDSILWAKIKSTSMQISSSAATSEVTIELGSGEKNFLAVHETQLAIYETETLELLKQWTIAKFCARIAHAAYSCDGQLVYAAMRDGIVLILSSAELTPTHEIDPSAYLPPRLRVDLSPTVVAAHPGKAGQLAVGLSNGAVAVIEPGQVVK
ncbi:protein TOPLESS-like [Andrographis paniculata]|uniref:protein TOPLESS-like n=1 Tax=Andrographis paniculata TaxID=175694 RepID=UPI0021E81C86|nr:protein TOPLESS-like [Andrographis paniculata]XP_051137731.1 protein TOPLESS-like [Andrographis paniculata]